LYLNFQKTKCITVTFFIQKKSINITLALPEIWKAGYKGIILQIMDLLPPESHGKYNIRNHFQPGQKHGKENCRLKHGKTAL